jgi:rod shape-determining protein MreD
VNWLAFVAVLLVTLLLQTTVCPLGDLPLIDVDLLLALTLIYGFAAPSADARLAGWIIGCAYDLMTEGPLGLHAFALGLTGLFLTQIRDTFNHHLWWVRLLVGFAAALPGELLIPLHIRFIQGGQITGAWTVVGSAVALAAPAALIAALVTRWLPMAPRRLPHRRASWSRG